MKLYKNGSMFKLVYSNRVLIAGLESVVKAHALETGMEEEDWNAAIADMQSKDCAIANFGVINHGFIFSVAA